MSRITVPPTGRGPDTAPGKARLRRPIVEMPTHLIGEVAITIARAALTASCGRTFTAGAC